MSEEQLEFNEINNELYKRSKQLGYDFLKERVYIHKYDFISMNYIFDYFHGKDIYTLNTNLKNLSEYITKIIDKFMTKCNNEYKLDYIEMIYEDGCCVCDREEYKIKITYKKLETEDEFLNRKFDFRNERKKSLLLFEQKLNFNDKNIFNDFIINKIQNDKEFCEKLKTIIEETHEK